METKADYTVTTTADVSPDGLIRINHAPMGRVVVVDGKAYFEVKDRNHNRSGALGRILVRIEWESLVNSVEEFIGSALW